MASYHFSVQIIGRGKGRSAVEAAAYRAGVRLPDERRGTTHDYSGRRGIAHAEILLPEGAAPWLADRVQLWNHVEAFERRRDAQLAREINMALPHELSADDRLDLVRTFVRDQFVSRGMVADVALHEPVAERGDDPRNFHAHVMLTLRQAEATGLRQVKTREWNSDELLNSWHAAWSAYQNRALERAGEQARVDHRRLAVQRSAALARGDHAAAEALARQPEVHMGPKVRAARREGRQPRESRELVRSTARPTKGRWASARDKGKRQRIVSYPVFDRGSRVDWNAAVVDGNRRRTYERVDKFERQAARLRMRQARALRLLGQPGTGGARLRLAERHIQRSRGFLAEIERILAQLFRMRGLWLGRYRVLTRDISLPGRAAGRGRRRSQD